MMARDLPAGRQAPERASAIPNTPTPDELVEMYRRMLITRAVEAKLGELAKAGRTRGPIHCCDGQEAVGVAACAALDLSDTITSTHRGHAHYIGKGVDVRAMMAEILGRSTGSCGGRAGHMLVTDAGLGLLGGNAIVGAGLTLAVGHALAHQVLKNGRVSLCFFGDGAAQTGGCHEAMNIAALWKLPLVFLCENNEYGLTVRIETQSSTPDIAGRASGYGMPGVVVDGNDVTAVYAATREAALRARRGDGPTLIEARTYRMTGFSTSDMGGYQSEEEMKPWRERDPILRLRAALSDSGIDLDAIERDAGATVDAATEQALADPWPNADYVSDEYAREPA